MNREQIQRLTADNLLVTFANHMAKPDEVITDSDRDDFTMVAKEIQTRLKNAEALRLQQMKPQTMKLANTDVNILESMWVACGGRWFTTQERSDLRDKIQDFLDTLVPSSETAKKEKS